MNKGLNVPLPERGREGAVEHHDTELPSDAASGRELPQVERSNGHVRRARPGEYVLSLPAEVTLHHYQLWRQFVLSKKPCVEFAVEQKGGTKTIELTVIGRERKGLLAELSDKLKAYGFNIVAAKLFTLPSDSVMDIFRLDDSEGTLEDDARASRLYHDLVRVMIGETALPEPGPSNQETRISKTGETPPARPDASASTAARADVVPEAPSARVAAAAAIANAEGQRAQSIERSLSNIALSDLEQRAREVADRRYLEARRDADRDFLRHGSVLYRYSFSSGRRRREHVCVDIESRELRWSSTIASHSSSHDMQGRIGTPERSHSKPEKPIRIHSVSLETCERIVHGPFSSVFATIGADKIPDPDWLCFSLILNERTVDLAAVTEDELMAWIFGLQNLCERIRPADRLTRHTVLVNRARMKLRAIAHEQNMTTRAFLLRYLRHYGLHLRAEDVSLEAGQFFRPRKRVETTSGASSTAPSENIAEEHAARDANTTLEIASGARTTSPVALSEPCLAERASHTNESVVELRELVRRLQRDLDVSRDRINVLKTKLRDAQKSWEIDFGEIKLREKIGSGAFSELYKAEWRASIVAAKVISVEKGAESVIQSFCDEVNVISKLRHSNILLFLGAVPRIPRLAIITEFCFGGSVYHAIRSPTWRRLQHADLVSFARDTARGMAYLHACGLIHRDLKSQNLLLDKPLSLGRPTVKVADFGLARGLSSAATAATSSSTSSSAGVMTAETGTYRWMAPEMIRHERYTEKVDIYSFGITIWEFFSGEIPYASMTPIQAAFAVADKGARPPLRAGPEAKTSWRVPPQWAHLMEQCWKERYVERPSFQTIVQWLNAMEHADPRQPPSWMDDSSERASQRT